jgi:DNA-binding transcriptional ArsR family regulator
MTRKPKPLTPVYSALSDQTRCRIIEILTAGPAPVHELANAFAISRPAISRHLRVLKEAGVVAEVRKGRENLYALRPEKLGKAIDWIEAMLAPKPAAAQKVVRTQSPAKPSLPVPKTTPAPEAPKPTNQMGFDF